MDYQKLIANIILNEMCIFTASAENRVDNQYYKEIEEKHPKH
jgi:hypothetical protein